MKKNTKLTITVLAVLSLIIGCVMAPMTLAEGLSTASGSSEAVLVAGATPSSKNGNASDGTTAAAETVVPVEVDASISARDASGEYDAQKAVALSPDDDLTITEEGIYILSGNYENKMIIVDAGKEAKIQIVLNNAVLTNENGPVIYVRSADKVFLTAAEGSENIISDGSGYTVTEDDTTLDAAVFSKEDLTINGSGKLTINGNNKHAVVSKDDLVITAKNLTVTAVNAGLYGKDSVRLSGAAVSVTAGTDGIRSDNGTDASLGFVSAENSTITVVSGKDAIQAETAFLSNNSAIVIRSGSGSSGKSNAAESYKGIKAGVAIEINGGSYEIDSLDDAIHTNGYIIISSGSFVLRSNDDGIHADQVVGISGGTLDITAYEGIEATYILISGGEITIQASDDGINAARKTNIYTPTVEITGGTVTVTMGAGDTDGIDSNGNIIISGGTIYVNGNSPFDYDGSASFTGGSVYVNGSQVTTLPNQMMGGFGGRGGFSGGWGQQQGGFSGGWGQQQGGFGGQGPRH